MLSVPQQKDCKEDTTCARIAHMTLKAAEQDRTLEIALQILVNTISRGTRGRAYIVGHVELPTSTVI